MNRKARRRKYNCLARALARGDSVTKWARANEVSLATAYRWANHCSVNKLTDQCRGRRLALEATGVTMVKLGRRAGCGETHEAGSEAEWEARCRRTIVGLSPELIVNLELAWRELCKGQIEEQPGDQCGLTVAAS
jgi:hypothetical protein